MRNRFLLAISPEQVDPGNAVFKINNTPKVVGRETKNAMAGIKDRENIELLYSYSLREEILYNRGHAGDKEDMRGRRGALGQKPYQDPGQQN